MFGLFRFLLEIVLSETFIYFGYRLKKLQYNTIYVFRALLLELKTQIIQTHHEVMFPATKVFSFFLAKFPNINSRK